MNFLSKFQNQAYALMRMVVGFLFLWHGTQKLFNVPAEFGRELTPMMVSAGLIELVGGTLVMIGLFTRPAAFICSGTMAAAYWIAHVGQHLFPLLNGGELAALYCFVFLYIATKGPGIWSIGK